MVGKWHLGMQMPGDFGARDWRQPLRDMPLDRGFDYFFGIPASLNFGVLAWFEGRHATKPPTLYTGKKPNRRHVDYRIKPPYQESPQAVRKAIAAKRLQVIEVAEDFVDDQCLTRFTDQAIQWIRQHQRGHSDSPFFLYLPLTSPHYPVCPRPQFHGQGDCGGYGEFMIETDYHVGRVLECLKELQLAANTLVIYTSDNGPERSWRQRVTDFGHHSNGGFRGGKRDIYEGGHRVPMLMRWPAGIAAPGRRSSTLVGQTDLMATLSELTGFHLPDDAGEDSQSFAPVLSDASGDHKRKPLVNHAANGRFAITAGDWKLIMPHRKLELELYRLKSDREEAINLAQREPMQVNRLKRQLTEIVGRGRTTAGPTQRNDTGYWSDLTWMTAADYDALQGQEQEK